MPNAIDLLFRPLATPDLPDAQDAIGHEAALAVLDRLADGLARPGAGPGVTSFGLGDLAPDDLEFLLRVLGEGEVSLVCGPDLQAEETMLPGVWRLRAAGSDGGLDPGSVEVGAFPPAILERAFAGASAAPALPAQWPEGVYNAPALLAEIAGKAGTPAGAENHVINLTVLPHTGEDLALLDEVLGRGPLTAVSRGYGSCHVATASVAGVWWVRQFNSGGTVVLNAIEIGGPPDVLKAAPEDLAESALRLDRIRAHFAGRGE